ncbi:hypothetical protein, conserved [Plasmodium gonderi]|uniref:Uncharacterized protein n=1 Tax=Plasmodium gonderi TaxID=77519 RepID=A0A1Y1JCR1_PLAGO|nr:hypothetical protein, conserved [Plasmodium gonderi]GAW80266.1 hypothetical protein, conserved [Plasmodium gonderi]
MIFLLVIFLIILSLSFNEQFHLRAKRIQRPINVYYKDYSEKLSKEQKDKLMKILLYGKNTEPEDDTANSIDINKMYAKEKELESLLKGQEELSRQIRKELHGYTRGNKQMSIKYNHGINTTNGDDSTDVKKGEDHFDVDTEIDVSTDSMREPIVLIKIPAVNIYNQMEMLHDIGDLMDLKNEDMFY